MQERYRFTTLVRPIRAPDGDTIYASCMDFGQGSVQLAPAESPFKLRLVGPDGVWFDAAESRGRRARPEGKQATQIMRSLLEPILADDEMWIACETFKNRHPDTRDSFGRYLYYPYAVVDGRYAMHPFDPCGAIVAAGVGRYGGRFGEPR